MPPVSRAVPRCRGRVALLISIRWCRRGACSTAAVEQVRAATTEPRLRSVCRARSVAGPEGADGGCRSCGGTQRCADDVEALEDIATGLCGAVVDPVEHVAELRRCRTGPTNAASKYPTMRARIDAPRRQGCRRWSPVSFRPRRGAPVLHFDGIQVAIIGLLPTWWGAGGEQPTVFNGIEPRPTAPNGRPVACVFCILAGHRHAMDRVFLTRRLSLN